MVGPKNFVVFKILCYPSVMENTFLHFKKVTSDRDDQQHQAAAALFRNSRGPSFSDPIILVSTLRSEFKSRWEFIILFIYVVQFSLECKRRIAFIFVGFYLTKFYL